MRGIRQQIIDSVEWCFNNIPIMDNPEQLFYFLKNHITFKHDPENVELLQEAQTLFEDNYHGRVGYGDCDCFSILQAAAWIAQGWGDQDIALAGRSRINPVHIYNQITWDGRKYVADLTEPRFNQERDYPLKQVLPIKFYNL